MSIDLSFFHALTLVKISLAVLLGIFIIFLFVIVTQVRTMNRLITQTFVSTALFIISLLLLLAAISLFIATLVIL